MRAILYRITQNDKQTVSHITVLSGKAKNEKVEFYCWAIELPDRDNQNSISRIPSGVYEVVKRNSPKYGNHFHVLDVEGRSFILIHVGNYYTQTRGCILPGASVQDINKDGIQDVVSSGATMDKLNAILPDCFNLTIVDEV